MVDIKVNKLGDLKSEEEIEIEFWQEMIKDLDIDEEFINSLVEMNFLNSRLGELKKYTDLQKEKIVEWMVEKQIDKVKSPNKLVNVTLVQPNPKITFNSEKTNEIVNILRLLFPTNVGEYVSESQKTKYVKVTIKTK